MEFSLFLRAVLALGFVISLLGLFAWAARRYNFAQKLSGNLKTDKRLSVSEMLRVDSKRILLLVRRDGVEHLVLLSPASETVIETGIPVKEAQHA